MNQISQTQLSNFMTAAGLITLVLAKFGVAANASNVAFVLGAAWSIGWTVYSYVQRYQKGDLTLSGIRK